MNSNFIIRIILILNAGLISEALQAQEAIPAAGGNASGSGGSVSFSVGQVFYTVNSGTTGFEIQGVQQPFEISEATRETQNIPLSAGWNIFSAHVTPDNPDMKILFQSLITDGSLIKVQDETGNTLEDYGVYGGWVNHIGDIAATEGYKVKVSRDCLFSTEGTPVDIPIDIPLSAGWNIIGYPHTLEIDAMEVVQQLIDRGTLIKVQDEKGNSVENWGIYGGWKNLIGNMAPGEGYKIKVNAGDVLTLYGSYAKSATIVRGAVARLQHFLPVPFGNGLDHMNINLVDIPAGILEPGDEIAVFDGNLCVGALAVFSPQSSVLSPQSEISFLSIPVSASDGAGVSGFTAGNPFILKAWKKETGQEMVIDAQILEGAATFQKQETTLAKLGKLSTATSGKIFSDESPSWLCYPNPTTGKVYLKFRYFPGESVNIEVMNALGQCILTRITDAEPVMIDLSGNVSGVYYLKVMTNQRYETAKLILK